MPVLRHSLPVVLVHGRRPGAIRGPGAVPALPAHVHRRTACCAPSNRNRVGSCGTADGSVAAAMMMTLSEMSTLITSTPSVVRTGPAPPAAQIAPPTPGARRRRRAQFGQRTLLETQLDLPLYEVSKRPLIQVVVEVVH